jgi:two-component system response regulator VicR
LAEKMLGILVIDDEESIRDVIKEGLESLAGITVTTASDGEAGLRQIEEVAPDVVLLDLVLPRLDGFQVLDRIRSSGTREDQPTVIAMSALNDRVTLTRLNELGVDAVLPKPFTLGELRAVLATYG